MNLAATAPAWVLVILGVLLAAAAVEDSIRLRISNLTSAGVFIAALVAMALAGFPAALWQNAAVLAGLLFVGTLIFAAGQIGGGDVKLLAALGAWMNLQGALWLLVSVFLAGGVLALGFIAVRLLRGRGFKRRSDKAGGIPYGLAIVAGACIVVASQLGKL
jgi:prepilin peptidase CpaA